MKEEANMNPKIFVAVAGLSICFGMTACAHSGDSTNSSIDQTKASTTTQPVTQGPTETTLNSTNTVETSSIISKEDISKIYISTDKKNIEINPNSEMGSMILSIISSILQDDNSNITDGQILREVPGGLSGFSDCFFMEIEFVQPKEITFGDKKYTDVTALFYQSNEAVIFHTNENDLSGEITFKYGYLYEDETYFSKLNTTIEPLLQ